MFLVLKNAHSGYSMKYPEGWTIQGSGSDKLTISDKNNLARAVIIPARAARTRRSIAAILPERP